MEKCDSDNYSLTTNIFLTQILGIKFNNGLEINESAYAQEKEKEFLQTYNQLVQQYDISLKQEQTDGQFSWSVVLQEHKKRN